MKKSIHEESVGKRFGRLTVISISKTGKYYKFNCQCDCGAATSPNSFSVKNGIVSSCGCLQREYANKKKDKPSSLIKPNSLSAKNYVFLTYKRNARLREIDFNLTKDQLISIAEKSCFYCNSPPSQQAIYTGKSKERSGCFTYSGVDRYDNTKGYIVENCVPCCRTCNTAKGNKTIEEFKRWILNLIAHHTRFSNAGD